MLTSDLLRYEIGDHIMTPRYITRKQAGYYLKSAQDLISIYQEHEDKTQGELEKGWMPTKMSGLDIKFYAA